MKNIISFKDFLAEAEKKNLGLSLTKIKTFETCPYRYYLQYIKKVKIPRGAYNPKFFKKGQAFHKILDSLIKTGVACDFNSKTLGDEVKGIKNLCQKIYSNNFVQELLEYPHHSEYPFSIFVEDKKLRAIKKQDKTADFYGIIDFWAENGSELYIVDWKTGKVAQDNEDTFLQVYLYAKAIQLLNNNKFSKINVGYYYVEHDTKLMKTLSVKELDEKIENLLEKAYSIPQSDDPSKFPAKPSGLCKWCPFGKESLGICEYEK